MALLRFIAGYQEAHGGISPSFNEMQAGLGGRGKSALSGQLLALSQRGLVRRLPRKPRAIELLVIPTIPRAPDGAPLIFLNLKGTSHG